MDEIKVCFLLVSSWLAFDICIIQRVYVIIKFCPRGPTLKWRWERENWIKIEMTSFQLIGFLLSGVATLLRWSNQLERVWSRWILNSYYIRKSLVNDDWNCMKTSIFQRRLIVFFMSYFPCPFFWILRAWHEHICRNKHTNLNSL